MTKENQTQPVSGAMTDAEFLSKRLARVAKLAGVPMPDFSHEGIAEVAGTILGRIASKLEFDRAQDAQVVRNAALEEVKQLCRKWSSTAWIIPEISALQAAPTQPVERPDAVEPHYVIRYVKHYNGPLGDEYAIISKADWDNGMSRGVAKEVCWKDGTPLIVIPYTIAANQPQQVRGNAQEPVAWSEAERICSLPDVDEAMRSFSEDPTGDSATCLVRSILAAAPQVAQEEGK